MLVCVVAAGAWAQKAVTLKPKLDKPSRLSEWTIDGNGAFEVRDGMLVLTKAGVPGGPIRRPAGLAILKSEPLGRFTLEADVRSEEAEDLLVRDVDLIVDWQSPSRFYYIHLAGTTNDVHNGIFLVNDADRKRLDTPTSVPQLKDKAWHHMRLERDPATGRIAVYSNGATTPALEVFDATLQSGRIGFGSFDETGQFKNIVVTGTAQAR